MNKTHRKIIRLQARLADRVASRFEVSRVPFEPLCPEYQDHVTKNNIAFNPLASMVKSQSPGKKAQIARDLVRQELLNTHSSFSLTAWGNGFSVKSRTRWLLVQAGRLPEIV